MAFIGVWLLWGELRAMPRVVSAPRRAKQGAARQRSLAALGGPSPPSRPERSARWHARWQRGGLRDSTAVVFAAAAAAAAGEHPAAVKRATTLTLTLTAAVTRGYNPNPNPNSGSDVGYNLRTNLMEKLMEFKLRVRVLALEFEL